MPRTCFTTPPPARWARIAAQLSLGCLGGFILLLVALHLLRRDLDPSWRFISEYELGRYGWLMHLAFLLLGAGTSGVAVSIASEARCWRGYLGVALLAQSALGMFLAGVFAPSLDNRLHDLGAMLDAVPFAALLIAWSLSSNSEWISGRRRLWGVSLLPLVGFLVFVISLGVMLPQNGGRPGPAVLVGWQNRLMILTQCAWMITVAGQLLSRVPVIEEQAEGAARYVSSVRARRS